MVKFLSVFFVIFVLGWTKVWATPTQREAYLVDTRLEERGDVAREPLFLPVFSLGYKAPFSQVIFDSRISTELRAEYLRRFGQTSAEQMSRVYSNPTASFGDTMGPTYTAVQASEQEQLFADYMYRRLAEYHIDNFAKNDKTVRPVYEFKEKISRVEVSVAPGFSFTANYSFSGQYVDGKLNNPWVDTRIFLDLKTKGLGPFGSNEARLTLYKSILPSFGIENSYTFVEKAARIILYKSFSETVSTSLQYAIPLAGSAADRLILAGLGIIF